jgi:hypothetical protein
MKKPLTIAQVANKLEQTAADFRELIYTAVVAAFPHEAEKSQSALLLTAKVEWFNDERLEEEIPRRRVTGVRVGFDDYKVTLLVENLAHCRNVVPEWMNLQTEYENLAAQMSMLAELGILAADHSSGLMIDGTGDTEDRSQTELSHNLLQSALYVKKNIQALAKKSESDKYTYFSEGDLTVMLHMKEKQFPLASYLQAMKEGRESPIVAYVTKVNNLNAF